MTVKPLGRRAIGRDPTVFCDPEKFNPQRWLYDDGTIRSDLTSKINPFGFGRRSVNRMPVDYQTKTWFLIVASVPVDTSPKGMHIIKDYFVTCPDDGCIRSVFINTALLLWAFKISQVPSAPIDTLAFKDAMNAHPLPFQVHFQTRLHKPVELETIMRSYGH